MKIYDVSRMIEKDMVVYKNKEEKRIKRTVVADYERGSHYESRLETDMHCGSHIDAPLHMIEGGHTVEAYDLSRFIGRCKLFDMTGVDLCIRKKDIEGLPIEKNDRILFKTKNSYENLYNPNFVYIEEDAAQYLVDIGIQTVGIDAMSIERDKKEHPSHKIILGAGIGVIEDLRFSEVEAGDYFMSMLPLKIKGSEASPIRAILLQGNIDSL